MSTTEPTPIPEMIDQLEAAILNGKEPKAITYNVATLADLARRLHMTAITYRDLAGLNEGSSR